jgi:hypothetical protein
VPNIWTQNHTLSHFLYICVAHKSKVIPYFYKPEVSKMGLNNITQEYGILFPPYYIGLLAGLLTLRVKG